MESEIREATEIPEEVLKKKLPELCRIERVIQNADANLRVKVYGHVAVEDYRLPLYALELGSTSPNVPGIGFFGGIHGVERIGTEILVSFLYTLCERLKWESDLKLLLENVYIVMLPLVNPGGMWQKTRSNPHGIDLMRNAPIESKERTTFFVGGQRLSRFLPWYRGRASQKMQKEAQLVVDVVTNELLNRPLSIALDCHSGYGQKDRLWFLHANTKNPFKHLPEIYALKSLFEKTYPNHNYYTIEPQSKNYMTKGDLWDYLFQESLNREKGIFIPLTLELGSLFWVKKNLRQALKFDGYFNPVTAGRRLETLRKHQLLLEFLIRAARNYKNWLSAYSNISNIQQAALREWYSKDASAVARKGERWILIRGLIRESRHWGDFPELFKAHFPDSEIHTLDIPGTGKLNEQKTPRTIGGILDAFRSRIKELQIDPPYNIISISMGAMLVMEWLQQQPDEINKAVLINSSVSNFNPFYQRLKPDNYFNIIKSILIKRSAKTREKAIVNMTTNLIKDKDYVIKKWVEYAKERPVKLSNAFNQLFAASSYKIRGEIPKIPILVLGSAKDRLVHPNCSVQISKNWNVPLKMHPEAGHDLPLDDPLWVINSIEEWIKELAATRPEIAAQDAETDRNF